MGNGTRSAGPAGDIWRMRSDSQSKPLCGASALRLEVFGEVHLAIISAALIVVNSAARIALVSALLNDVPHENY